MKINAPCMNCNKGQETQGRCHKDCADFKWYTEMYQSQKAQFKKEQIIYGYVGIRTRNILNDKAKEQFSKKRKGYEYD